ncbi:MAG: YegS/Rv2252/BmrU family lipid kinase [Eggerthellaceae bacterium]|nr:YegS/Rv2252/BmrU family lipid kinase [Eggerthellaceae bacterium]
MSIYEGTILFIANPAAQRGNGAEAGDYVYRLLCDARGADAVQYVKTERPGHAIELAENAQSRIVIVLGGDGIVHEAVNGIMYRPKDNRPVFGLIPVGSGNDYAKTLGIPETVDAAFETLLKAQEQAHDVGVCNGEYFAETLSFGLDAAIALDTVKRRERTGQQGTPLYLASGLDQLLHHLDTYSMRATLDDGSELAGDIHMLAVQNGQTYGGGFRICPEASTSDGKLDLCWADAPMSMLEATVKFLSAKDAHHLKWKNIHFAKTSSLELSFDRRPPCQVDGEPHLADSYSIAVEPLAMRVLTAAK